MFDLLRVTRQVGRASSNAIFLTILLLLTELVRSHKVKGKFVPAG